MVTTAAVSAAERVRATTTIAAKAATTIAAATAAGTARLLTTEGSPAQGTLHASSLS